MLNNILNSQKIVLVIGENEDIIFEQQRKLLEELDSDIEIKMLGSVEQREVLQSDMRNHRVLDYSQCEYIKMNAESMSENKDVTKRLLILPTVVHDCQVFLVQSNTYILGETSLTGKIGSDLDIATTELVQSFAESLCMPFDIARNVVFSDLGYIILASNNGAKFYEVFWDRKYRKLLTEEIQE